MARLTVVLALACAGLASAGDKELKEKCKPQAKDSGCPEGSYCLGLTSDGETEGEKPRCLDKKTYCKKYQSTHDGGDDWTGTCSKTKSKSSSRSSGSSGGGVQLPTGQSFNLPIQIMCIGDSITYGGHGGEMRDPNEHIPVPGSVPDTDAEGEEVKIDSDGAVVYKKEFTLEKANYCSKMKIILDHAGEQNIQTYNLGVSGATAQSNTDRPWKEQGAYNDLKKHSAGCDVGIVMLGTNDAKLDYWKGGDNYKKEYKALLEDIGETCTLVLVGLSPPSECGSPDCRFGNPDKVGSLGDDTCCADAWGGPDEAHIINEDLPAIQRAVAKELGLATIPFREAIGEYSGDILEHIRSYFQNDLVHPNEAGYLQMADIAKVVLDQILKYSFWAKTDEAQAGARYTAGLAVVAVGGLFAVFAAISRKGRRGIDAGAKGYGAADPAEALLPVA